MLVLSTEQERCLNWCIGFRCVEGLHYLSKCDIPTIPDIYGAFGGQINAVYNAGNNAYRDSYYIQLYVDNDSKKVSPGKGLTIQEVTAVAMELKRCKQRLTDLVAGFNEAAVEEYII